jgi:flagellum-specific ATP synthase
MARNPIEDLCARLEQTQKSRPIGRVVGAGGSCVRVAGLAGSAAIGDQVRLPSIGCGGEVVDIAGDALTVLADGDYSGLRLGDSVRLSGPPMIAPDDSWVGRIIDAAGAPLDGRPLRRGPVARVLRTPAPSAVMRRPLGPRLSTGLAAFDTLLPLVRGQRIGLFSGSGVGKSMLLSQFAGGVESDICVVALIGERGRELRSFVEDALGPEKMARTVVIAATSDAPPVMRRRALWTAMTVAEHFREKGRHVLFLADSVTRFAEAHREIALAAGEPASLRGYPPSTAHMIMSVAERAGPGQAGPSGDITAVFTVLVAGSDMEEPIADILRGVLDGHVVLDRAIAERGRFPAVDLLRSVSRSLPGAANPEENDLIARARRRLGAYDRAELMIQSGLYAPGSDPEIDAAISVWPALDAFMSQLSPDGPEAAFRMLSRVLRTNKPRMARSA